MKDERKHHTPKSRFCAGTRSTAFRFPPCATSIRSTPRSSTAG